MPDLPPPAQQVYQCYIQAPIGAIRVPNRDQAAKTPTYQELICTPQNQADIRYIILNLATKNVLSLGVEKKEMDKAGERIQHVHPLKFLETIFTNPELKNAMPAIYSSAISIPWNRMIAELSAGLNREATKGTLMLYLPDFARQVGVDPAELIPFAEKQQWEHFVIFLMNS